jgi:hypothetical protein
MKTSKLFAAASALVLALGASACDSGLTEINENPNDPEVVPADNVFANGIASGVGRAFGANFNMTLTALWAQHMAKIQYIDEDRYDLRDQAVNAHWTGFYSVPLQDFQDVVNSGADNNRPNVEAQGLVMRSWLFQIMTDVWGDIPYSEALRGTGEARIVTPKYDTQEQVYNGILADLKRANDIIGAGAAINDGDLIYDGDMPSWKKFANSLRLRAAMRLSQVNPTLARTEAAAAIAAGVFTSNADNAVLNYTPSAPSQSPLYLNQIGFGGSRDDHGISATMVNTLKALNDPRLPVYAQPAPVDKQYRGAMNGPSDANAPVLNTISRLGTYFLRADWPAPLMTYAEVLFLRAEAAQRRGGSLHRGHPCLAGDVRRVRGGHHRVPCAALRGVQPGAGDHDDRAAEVDRAVHERARGVRRGPPPELADPHAGFGQHHRRADPGPDLLPDQRGVVQQGEPAGGRCPQRWPGDSGRHAHRAVVGQVVPAV